MGICASSPSPSSKVAPAPQAKTRAKSTIAVELNVTPTMDVPKQQIPELIAPVLIEPTTSAVKPGGLTAPPAKPTLGLPMGAPLPKKGLLLNPIVDKKSTSSRNLFLQSDECIQETIPRLVMTSNALLAVSSETKAKMAKDQQVQSEKQKAILVTKRNDIIAALEDLKAKSGSSTASLKHLRDDDEKPATEEQEKGSTESLEKKIHSPPNSPTLNHLVDIDNLIVRLLSVRNQKKLSRTLNIKNNEILTICRLVGDIFLRQPMLLELQPPVKIIGDIHGQYLDLLHIFDTCGHPEKTNYLFLGDYVDRGKQSLETILLLLCYKIKYPENFFLLRGNHECAAINRVYGFYDECKRRCNVKCWKSFTDVFNVLPVTAIVGDKIFCVHGGLSPGLYSMKQILQVPRPTDVPDFGFLNDLLWADPSETTVDWEENDRGVSYLFGKSVVDQFLNKHSLDLVCRAHTVVEDGYEFFNDRTLVTIFSAPNYCGEFDNYGAVMSVDENMVCSFQLIRQSNPLYKSNKEEGDK